MKFLLFALATLALMGSDTFAKEIALTFDDSPRFANGYFDGPTRAKKLIAQLKKHKTGPVVFFSVSGQMDEEGRSRLQSYANAGHIIANHTVSHPDFNKTSLKEYQAEFLRAHKELKHFKTFKKWFRFPYLREGNTKEKRDGMRELFNKSGYLNAYITINNYDWYIEGLFQRAVKKPNFNLERMRKFYVDVLMESVEHTDKMAVKQLGRSPKHVLLLHEMDISALFIGDLVTELRRRGWKIITAEEAYTDTIAKYMTPEVMPYNPGRIGEIAKDRGQIEGLWHETCDEKYLDKRFAREVLREK